MTFKINKKMILENALNAAKAAFFTGSALTADQIHNASSGYKGKIAGETAISKAKEQAFEIASNSNVLNSREKAEQNMLKTI